MTIGVVAYGSLLSTPGPELTQALDGDPIAGKTSFLVAFARLSQTRGGAPTLVPVDKDGVAVNGAVLRLKPDVTLDQARDMLYRRETHRPAGAPVSDEQRARSG